jgi:hypothetical protein
MPVRLPVTLSGVELQDLNRVIAGRRDEQAIRSQVDSEVVELAYAE